jgi:hypothetical protein
MPSSNHANFSAEIAILHLNLHRDFFAEIAAGEKRTEYRERTPYWAKRLEKRHYDLIKFRNGYATKAPEMLVEYLGFRRCSVKGKPHYAIRLGRVLKVTRWKAQGAAGPLSEPMKRGR